MQRAHKSPSEEDKGIIEADVGVTVFRQHQNTTNPSCGHRCVSCVRVHDFESKTMYPINQQL